MGLHKANSPVAETGAGRLAPQANKIPPQRTFRDFQSP